ncbi:response regulator [candidate division KSB1 bacterium]|nr:response regulator [candidate division KSB1 bacterium]
MKSNTDQPLFDNLKCIKNDLESNPENLEKYFQILKLASVGEMMGEISHTFNNILGGILGYSQLLKEQLQEGSDALRQAEVIEKASKRASKLVSQMQFFTQKQSYQKRIVDPKQIVTEVTLILESTFNKNIKITSQFNHGSARLFVDLAAIYQILLNICRNCKDAMPEGGELAMRTELKDQFVTFEISDTGFGIDSNDLPHIFEPFFSRKESGFASGMGLAVAEAIVKDNQGRIVAESEVGKGTVFRVFLPTAKPSGKLTKSADNQDKFMKADGELIMVVDDEEDLREMAKRILEKRGFKVVIAGSGETAIKVFEKHANEIKLVILDMILPEGDGTKVYKKIKELRKDSKFILTSGYIHNAPFQELIENNQENFLPKPWDITELIEEAERVLKTA